MEFSAILAPRMKARIGTKAMAPYPTRPTTGRARSAPRTPKNLMNRETRSAWTSAAMMFTMVK